MRIVEKNQKEKNREIRRIQDKICERRNERKEKFEREFDNLTDF